MIEDRRPWCDGSAAWAEAMDVAWRKGRLRPGGGAEPAIAAAAEAVPRPSARISAEPVYDHGREPARSWP